MSTELTPWIKTLSNYTYQGIVKYPYNLWQMPVLYSELVDPVSVILSGDGTVLYTLLDPDAYGYVCVVRQKYNITTSSWDEDVYLQSAPTTQYINGTKFLPNEQFIYPAATSGDGNTLILTNFQKKQFIIVTYSDGQLVQVGSPISFTPQSSFNNSTLNFYYIQRFFMSDNGLRFVIFTHGGMNTYVYTNGVWSLLPNSSDITSVNFPYRDWIYPAMLSTMSRDGNYLLLIEDTAPIDYILDFNVFKFDATTNNWVLFKKITINYSGIDTLFISNAGTIVIYMGDGSLKRYEYNSTTSSYQYVGETSYILSRGWNNLRVYMSGDCNKFFCRYRYFGNNPNEQVQAFRVLKYINGSWVIDPFPETVMSYMSPSQDFGGRLGTLHGVSSDGTVMVVSGHPLNVDYNSMSHKNLGPITIYRIKSDPKISVNGMSINGGDIGFTDATTFIKAPVSDSHVANKQYVDNADNEIHALIIANSNTDSVSTTQYYDLIAQRQTEQTTIGSQVEDLYQYFFNSSRSQYTPTRN